MAKPFQYDGVVPVHPVLGSVDELFALPTTSIVQVTGHDSLLFEFKASRGAFVTLDDGTMNIEPAELLADYSPVRLVWIP